MSEPQANAGGPEAGVLALPRLQPLPGMEAPASGQRRDAQEKREQILVAARQLFGRYGPAQVSMNQIAQAAEVGAGTLYRHFPNKGALSAALSVEATWRLADAVTQRLGRDEPGAAAEQLRAFVALVVAYNEENAPYLTVASSGDYGAEPNERFTNPLYTWLHGVLTALLRRAQRDGALAEENLPWLGDALLAMIEPAVYRYQRDVRGISAEQIASGAERLFSRLVS